MRPIRAFLALLTSLLMVFTAVPAGAAPDSAPTTVCMIDDERLGEVSGMVATDSGYAVINDGSEEILDVRVFLLDDTCAVEDIAIFPREPRDPEDLAQTADGTFWVGDLGDNNRDRTTAAVWMLRPNANTATLYRLKYPDGAHDAEALVMTSNKTPVVITKELSGTAQIYQATKPLTGPDATFEMKAMGTFQPEATGTPGGDPSGGAINQTVVTGAALSPDGKKVALRTYTDAYEWDVKDGDIAGAISDGKPRRTALPNEPLGEAIAYTSDGKSLLTASEGVGQPLQKWAPTTSEGATDDGAADKKAGPSEPWYSSLTLDQLMYLVYGLGVFGLALLGLGIFGMVRHRRRSKLGGDDDSPAGKPRGPRRKPDDTGARALPVRHGDGLYGRPLPDKPMRASGPATTYGRPRRDPPPPPRGGTVYGGGLGR